MNTVGIIPARLQSSRLPEKLLLNETGCPLIQYVWDVATKCRVLDEVIVATDSQRIKDVVTDFGGRAELTGDFPSGSDRVADVARGFCPDADAIVNLQGDEPELEVATLDALVAALSDSDAEMATIAAPVRDVDTIRSPDCVKVVVSDAGKALYFSRSVIPFPRGKTLEESLQESATQWLLHVGLYAYRRDFLGWFAASPPSLLERTEKLEQLRAIEAGKKILVAAVGPAMPGIDTPEDLAAFRSRFQH